MVLFSCLAYAANRGANQLISNRGDIVSAFGATDSPTSSGADAATTANTIAAWVKQYQLDGVDVDYEV